MSNEMRILGRGATLDVPDLRAAEQNVVEQIQHYHGKMTAELDDKLNQIKDVRVFKPRYTVEYKEEIVPKPVFTVVESDPIVVKHPSYSVVPDEHTIARPMFRVVDEAHKVVKPVFVVEEEQKVIKFPWVSNVRKVDILLAIMLCADIIINISRLPR